MAYSGGVGPEISPAVAPVAGTKILLRRSGVQGKLPSAGDAEYGELFINYHSGDPMLCFKDNSDNIVEIKPARAIDGGGGEVPPDTGNTEGDLIWDGTHLRVWDGNTWLAVGPGSLAYIQKADMGTVTNTAGDGFDIPLVNNLQAGLMAPGDKNKLDGYPASPDALALDLQAVTDNGNTTTNSAVFGGSVRVGSNTGDGAGDGTFISASGAVNVSRADADVDIWRGYTTGDNTITSRIDAAGKAQFGAGNITLNEDGSGQFSDRLGVGVAPWNNVSTAIKALPDHHTGIVVTQPGKTTANAYQGVSVFPVVPDGVTINESNSYLAFLDADVAAATTNCMYRANGQISSVPGQTNYNFFAGDLAPNFFLGDTYIGGTHTRNTRELWESLLTEEQKEELAAGTLAIPANVETPGDGSFFRQWYYDQQDAETQALLNSGELEYPELLQPANFVDSFALGDNTNINLNSNGRIDANEGYNLPSQTRFPDSISYGLFRGSYTLTLAVDQKRCLNATNRGTIALGYDVGVAFDATGFKIKTTIPKSNSGVAINVEALANWNVTDGDGNAAAPDEVFNFRSGISPDQTQTTGYFGHFQASTLQSPFDPADASSNHIGFLAANTIANKAKNNYGFKCDMAAGSENNFAFYSSGNAPNYFGGQVRIGALNDSPALASNSGIWLDTYGLARIGNQSVNATDPCIILNRGNSSTAKLIEFKDSSGTVDSISFDGAGGITYGTSDYRLKENIVDLPSATDAIKSLRPVNYNFKTHPGKTRPGFIAHEVAETLPVAVTGTKDAEEAIGTLRDAEGTILEENVTEPDASGMTYEEQVEVSPYVAGVAEVIDEETGEVITPAVEEQEAVYETVTKQRTWEATGTQPVYQGVDQTKLIPLLTKALQEALERIEVLEAKLA